MTKWCHPQDMRSRARYGLMTPRCLLLMVSLVIVMGPNSCLGVKSSSQYLYSGVEGHKVQEYIAQPGQQEPDFLFSSSYPNARVVEFYAQ